MKLVLYSCLESCYYTTFFDILYYYSDLFFFKQKTAYEMRISDWSSDVCSSDLLGGLDLLPWSDAARSLRMRAAFAGVEALSDAALMETLDEWLPPLLQGRRRLSDIDRSQLSGVLEGLIGWDGKQQVDRIAPRTEEHTSELQSLMRNSHAVFCLKKK